MKRSFLLFMVLAIFAALTPSLAHAHNNGRSFRNSIGRVTQRQFKQPGFNPRGFGWGTRTPLRMNPMLAGRSHFGGGNFQRPMFHGQYDRGFDSHMGREFVRGDVPQWAFGRGSRGLFRCDDGGRWFFFDDGEWHILPIFMWSILTQYGYLPVWAFEPVAPVYVQPYPLCEPYGPGLYPYCVNPVPPPPPMFGFRWYGRAPY